MIGEGDLGCKSYTWRKIAFFHCKNETSMHHFHIAMFRSFCKRFGNHEFMRDGTFICDRKVVCFAGFKFSQKWFYPEISYGFSAQPARSGNPHKQVPVATHRERGTKATQPKSPLSTWARLRKQQKTLHSNRFGTPRLRYG